MTETQTAQSFTRNDIVELRFAQQRIRELGEFIVDRYKLFLEITGDESKKGACSLRVKDPLKTVKATNGVGEEVESFAVTISWGGDQFGETISSGYVPVDFVFSRGEEEEKIQAALKLVASYSGLTTKNDRRR